MSYQPQTVFVNGKNPFGVITSAYVQERQTHATTHPKQTKREEKKSEVIAFFCGNKNAWSAVADVMNATSWTPLTTWSTLKMLDKNGVVESRETSVARINGNKIRQYRLKESK